MMIFHPPAVNHKRKYKGEIELNDTLLLIRVVPIKCMDFERLRHALKNT